MKNLKRMVNKMGGENLNTAIGKSLYALRMSQKWYTVEELKYMHDIKGIGIPALARSLRRAVKKGIIVSQIRQGTNYKEFNIGMV
jgi:hypothetical protein